MSGQPRTPGSTPPGIGHRSGEGRLPAPARGDAPPPPQREVATGGALTRVTANFTPRAMAALDKLAAQTGDSKTDILNRSVMVYEVFLELMERSGGTLRVVYPDGSQEQLRFIG